jgi:hypothetical protein
MKKFFSKFCSRYARALKHHRITWSERQPITDKLLPLLPPYTYPLFAELCDMHEKIFFKFLFRYALDLKHQEIDFIIFAY